MRKAKPVIALLAASLVSFAQIGTSTITGRVTDSSGAVVPNVAVVVTAKATNVSTNVVTNNDGIYRVPSLPPVSIR